MRTETELTGDITKNGQGTYEVLDVSIELDDNTRQQWESDPRGTLIRFLESQGFKVNGMSLPSGIESPSGRILTMSLIHINKGDRESHYFVDHLPP
ncbi:hypothetical protein ACH4Q6_01600 [Streptomyces lydicus]|uniref:hypothetical protein n=1 Tax=Streptomyces lydicus TaxID=47763 RepID=UPI0037AFD38E